MTRAAVGFTVKSGWACAVLLTGSADAPEVVDCRRIELSDPDVPESRQPYHDGFGTARAEGRELTRLVTSVERFGRKSVTGLIRGYTDGHRLRGVGVVERARQPDRATMASTRGGVTAPPRRAKLWVTP